MYKALKDIHSEKYEGILSFDLKKRGLSIGVWMTGDVPNESHQMKRIQLFEFEDLRWFPDWLRQDMTLFLVVFHRMVGTSRALVPLLVKVVGAAGNFKIVDLCSGGGGPMVDSVQTLRASGIPIESCTFTDLYPSKLAARNVAALNIPGLEFRLQPVDATNVPPELQGVRTMIASFHHMRPDNARKILADAFVKRQPICILEPSDNAPPTFLFWVAIPFAFLMAVLLTPFIRPLSFRILFFTYVLPLLPLCIAWDGAASNARIYNTQDLQQMTGPLQSARYTWEIGRVWGRGGWMQYLLGIPS
jgi:hypothetical protein